MSPSVNPRGTYLFIKLFEQFRYAKTEKGRLYLRVDLFLFGEHRSYSSSGLPSGNIMLRASSMVFCVIC